MENLKLLVINGPNLNLLGSREPKIYGTETYESLNARIRRHAAARGIEVAFYQSNHEGDLVDAIQQSAGSYDGIIINAAAYTHTSIALADALRAVNVPAVEVHISDIDHREAFRRTNYISPICIASVVGEGTNGYIHALDQLRKYLLQKKPL